MFGSGYPFSMVGPVLASASAIAVTHAMHGLSGSTDIDTIEGLPQNFTGPVILYNQGLAIDFTENGNILRAFTLPPNSCVVMMHVNGVWRPSM